MQNLDKHSVNLSKPEEIAYWAKLLKVAPLQLIKAVKVTGSNMINRVIYYLKAEGVLPFYFDVNNIAVNR